MHSKVFPKTYYICLMDSFSSAKISWSRLDFYSINSICKKQKQQMRILYMIYAAFMIIQFIKNKLSSTDNNTDCFKYILNILSLLYFCLYWSKRLNSEDTRDTNSHVISCFLFLIIPRISGIHSICGNTYFSDYQEAGRRQIALHSDWFNLSSEYPSDKWVWWPSG